MKRKKNYHLLQLNITLLKLTTLESIQIYFGCKEYIVEATRNITFQVILFPFLYKNRVRTRISAWNRAMRRAEGPSGPISGWNTGADTIFSKTVFYHCRRPPWKKISGFPGPTTPSSRRLINLFLWNPFKNRPPWKSCTIFRAGAVLPAPALKIVHDFTEKFHREIVFPATIFRA